MTESRKLQFKTSLNHRILSIVGFDFLFFEFVFLLLFFSKDWFALDISFAGIPTILLISLFVFFFLKSLETKTFCHLVSPIWKGTPPLPFENWLALDDSGITFGTKHVLWQAVDELHLSLLGNLVIKSRALCGTQSKEADIVLKIPFSIIDTKQQRLFLEEVLKEQPQVIVGKKLQTARKDAVVKGTEAVQLLGALIMSLALLDLSYSSFYYLELLKNYYLSETALLESNKEKSETFFKRGEFLLARPLPVSFAANKLLQTSGAAAGIQDARSEIFWLKGERDKAISTQEEALSLQSNSLKRQLHLVRMFAENDNYAEAKKRLLETIKNHESALSPRLYLLSLAKSQEDKASSCRTYQDQMDQCYETTFGKEPNWPPGCDRFYSDSIYSDDLRFILNRLIDCKYENKQDFAS
ncbi:MAG: hypothetical protein K2W82_01895 [Candidatus Obscuribacterales bacterium]|nr:hypothetical protein [Candidatus Obscuribacterales bacterium]